MLRRFHINHFHPVSYFGLKAASVRRMIITVMKTGFFLAVVSVALTMNVEARASDAPCHADAVVSKVSFENTGGLSPNQQMSLRKLLLGRCFYRRDDVKLSEAVYNQLRGWGYRRATVYDPLVRVLDQKSHPSPVAVVIDLRLR
jgi:hypothetical protein